MSCLVPTLHVAFGMEVDAETLSRFDCIVRRLNDCDLSYLPYHFGNRLSDRLYFGKAYITKPDLVEDFKKYTRWAAWDESIFYKPGAKGNTDYPILRTL